MPATGYDQSSKEPRIDLIVRMAVVMELVLIVGTWRLWFAATDFPRVPLVTVFLHVPILVVRTVSSALLVSLSAAAVSGWRQQCCPDRQLLATTFLLGCTAVLCNQHCLQPWHWLFLFIMAFRVTLSPEFFPSVVRRLLPFIYIFAAVSRFGPEIDSGISRRIVTSLLDMIGLEAVATQAQTVSWLCTLTTTTELATGILLLVPRAQRIGTVFAVVMHVTLMAVLGPTGLNQYAAVVIWNGFLTPLVVLLYWNHTERRLPHRFSVTVATALCFIWPALALFGITDNWTGWQLYSPRPEVLQLQIHSDAVSELPSSVIPCVGQPDPFEEWCSVRIDRWSLQSTGVPLYPQARFQLAVAEAVTGNISNDDHVRARLLTPGKLRWWNRTTTKFANRLEITQNQNDHWLNCRPVKAGTIR